MQDEVTVKIATNQRGEGLPVPEYSSVGSAGLDLRAAIDDELVIDSGEWVSVPLGFSIEIPEGYEGQIRPRSGLALRRGITILNSPGTVDSDYRGEVRATLINLGKQSFTVRRGDRIAQLVIAKVAKVRLRESDELGETARGEGGFGHTGIIHSRDVHTITKMGRIMNTTLFVKNGPCMAGLGLGGEGYPSFSIATPTGEGVTSPMTFTRQRRCAMVEDLRII